MFFRTKDSLNKPSLWFENGFLLQKRKFLYYILSKKEFYRRIKKLLCYKPPFFWCKGNLEKYILGSVFALKRLK